MLPKGHWFERAPQYGEMIVRVADQWLPHRGSLSRANLSRVLWNCTNQCHTPPKKYKMSIDTMEMFTPSQPEQDLPSLVRDGRRWTSLVVRTLVRIIGESSDEGGLTYEAAIAHSRRELADEFTHLTHDWDFFDDILNRLSIDRVVDSNVGDRLFLTAPYSPGKADRSLGQASLRLSSGSSEPRASNIAEDHP